MNPSDTESYHSVVFKRMGVNFETKEVWLDDQPEKGEGAYRRMEEMSGEAFCADLPDVVLASELEEVDRFIRGLLDMGDRMAVIRAMADIRHGIEFLHETDPDQAWEEYRKMQKLKQRHEDVVVKGWEEASEN